MQCEFCDGTTIEKNVTRMHWLDGDLYMVENVPAIVCRQCGERYFHAKTLDAIDTKLRSDHQVERELSVEVVNY